LQEGLLASLSQNRYADGHFGHAMIA